jgi:hypothetical protein
LSRKEGHPPALHSSSGSYGSCFELVVEAHVVHPFETRSWTYYHLYMILDIYRRYAVGWMLAAREPALLAEKLIAATCAKQGITCGEFTIHADRGSSMTSKPIAFLLAALGITQSHSRHRALPRGPRGDRRRQHHPRRHRRLPGAQVNGPGPSTRRSARRRAHYARDGSLQVNQARETRGCCCSAARGSATHSCSGRQRIHRFSSSDLTGSTTGRDCHY